MVRNGNFGPNLVVFEQKILFSYKMDPVFFIKSAENGSFFINTNILINGRIYTPDTYSDGAALYLPAVRQHWSCQRDVHPPHGGQPQVSCQHLNLSYDADHEHPFELLRLGAHFLRGKEKDSSENMTCCDL